MNGDYLWDRSGAPDPQVQELERLLGPLGDPGTPRRRAPSWTWALAAAAVICLGVGLTWWWTDARRPGFVVEAAGRSSMLRAGEWMTASGETVVRIGEIGQVSLEPGSRVRAEAARSGAFRLRLEQGKLEALIVAPPRSFAVDTPSARAVDLGCAYTLEVEPGGGATVRVRAGWVAFARAQREVFIPAGARCRTGVRRGLGLPVYEDASPELASAVEGWEEGRGWQWPANVRAKDALTLWHALGVVEAEERGRVFDRLAGLVKVPVERERVVRGERVALEEVWRCLGLGDAGFWRQWQQEL